MKPSKLILLQLLLISMSLGIFSACSSSRKASKNQAYSILLKKGQDVSHILQNYKDYKPSGLKPSSRVLNQYRVVFTYRKKDEKQLQQQLASDALVVKFRMSEKTDVDIQTGSNEKKSKTKPIRKN